MTYNHLPLVRLLQADTRTRNIRDLARFTAAEWRDLIARPASNGVLPGAPPDVQGANDDERMTTYARVLTDIVEDAFPTAVLADRLRRDEDSRFSGRQDALRFFANEPEFEFELHDIDEYIDSHRATALGGIANPAALREHLKRMRRLFALTPRSERYAALQPLLERPEIGSARAIERMGQAAFTARFGAAIGGQSRARTVFSNALLRSSIATTLYTQFSPAMNSFGLVTAPHPPTSPPDVPSWETLFGSLELCGCEQCTSVLSPAAYMVDALAFLRDNGLIEGFFDRRADIGNLELSCANSNTTLPYIDLVNETLEQAVSGNHVTYQTDATAEELRAQPAHTDAQAYQILLAAVFPWNLPFDLWQQEARAFLALLGVARHEIMHAFQRELSDPPLPNDSFSPSELSIALERLGLNNTDRRAIVGQFQPGQQARDFWGLTGGNWESDLRRLPVFLSQSGLSYREAVELLSTTFVNPNGPIQIHFDGASCDPARGSVAALNEVSAGRIHRFGRLARKLQLPFYDLDRALAAIGGGILDDAFLRNFATVRSLQDQLPVPLAEMLSWWSPIDTLTYAPAGGTVSPSLYARLFLNRTVFSETQLAPFQLPALGLGGATLTANAPVIMAVLGISEPDFGRSRDGMPDLLDLAQLSQLYRSVSLAKAYALTIP